jgi:NitT/TauT family transport system substrate-binding protein
MQAAARTTALALLAAFIAAAIPPANAQEKVLLRIGYQPWWAGGITADVIRALGPELWNKYLPRHAQVEFQASPQGPVIINNMLAGKVEIGYMGDMPAVVSTTKQAIADVRMVAVTSFSPGQMCHLLMVRQDAPAFKSPAEAIKWLDGKTVAAPKGGCTDLFFRTVMKASSVQPKEYQHQGVEAIITNFRAKKIDAAVIPDIPRARLEAEKIARVVATGHQFNLPDAGIMVMRKDFMDKHPDVAKGWLKMELHVQRQYMLEPKNWDRVAAIGAEQNPGYSKQQVWLSQFARIPEGQGGAAVKQSFPFVIDAQVKNKLTDAFRFLHEIKVIDVEKPRDGAMDDSLARQVAADEKAKLPLGEIVGRAASDAPK